MTFMLGIYPSLRSGQCSCVAALRNRFDDLVVFCPWLFSKIKLLAVYQYDKADGYSLSNNGLHNTALYSAARRAGP